jgi:DNA-binding winged helix-turn-helix (wHTH) protein
MASKTLSFYDEKPGSPRRMAAIELRGQGEEQIPATLRSLSIVTSNENSYLQPSQTDLLGSENYQVALVTPGEPAPQFRVGTPDIALPILLLPFTLRQLIARVQEEADHARSLQCSVVMFGDVRVDLFRWEVSRSDIPVVLTALEFKLLRFFVTCPGRVISRDELLNQVWGFENYPTTRTVDNHVCRLRKKLEPDPACPVHFQTVHNVGYKFVLEASRSAVEQRM